MSRPPAPQPATPQTSTPLILIDFDGVINQFPSEAAIRSHGTASITAVDTALTATSNVAHAPEISDRYAPENWFFPDHEQVVDTGRGGKWRIRWSSELVERLDALALPPATHNAADSTATLQAANPTVTSLPTQSLPATNSQVVNSQAINSQAANSPAVEIKWLSTWQPFTESLNYALGVDWRTIEWYDPGTRAGIYTGKRRAVLSHLREGRPLVWIDDEETTEDAREDIECDERRTAPVLAIGPDYATGISRPQMALLESFIADPWREPLIWQGVGGTMHSGHLGL